MYKLLAIDLDGTLLNSQGTVSNENVKALQAAHDAGLKIVIATGRPIIGTTHARQLLNGIADDYLIAYNGALTLDIRRGTDLFSQPITVQDYRDVSAFAQSQGLYYYCFDRDSVLTPALHPVARWEHEINQVPVKYWQPAQLRPGQKILKINTSGPKEVLDLIEENPPRGFASRFTIVRTQPDLLEFLHPKAGKGIALEHLALHLGICQTEIISIGDSGNDLDMVTKAGLGIAMGNAVERVKAAAQMITRSNDNHGVAAALGQLSAVIGSQ